MRIIGNRGNTARKVQAVASGTLPNGKAVIVNANGTVSAISATGSPESVGATAQFDSGSPYEMSIADDTGSDRIVICYRDDGNSSYGTAVVGQVNSDSSISFGTPVVFESATTEGKITYDVNANKVLIAFTDFGNSEYGKAIVGTVNPSNNSISFGTVSVFRSGSSRNVRVTYTAEETKNVIIYTDQSDSNYGKVIVATISGTSVAFGSAAAFQQTSVDQLAIVAATASVVLIGYRDRGNGDKGYVRTIDVAGTNRSVNNAVVFTTENVTSISLAYDTTQANLIIAYRMDSPDFGAVNIAPVENEDDIGTIGSQVNFLNANLNFISANYNSDSNQVVITYARSTTGGLKSGTISGTSISFGDEFAWDSGSISYPASTYDTTTKKTIIAFRLSNTSKAKTYSAPSTNLTSENYIGIASNGYATGQAATINVKGFIDDNQSSLTAGQSYYVQSNGDLGLTAADPSVFAGTAVSATKLIVKG